MGEASHHDRSAFDGRLSPVILDLELEGESVRVDVDADPPLGHRFWRAGGWAGDPVEPTPYGGAHCLALVLIETATGPLWLCAMEVDRSFRLAATHDLFPAPEHPGATAFAAALFDRHTREPRLI